MQLTGSMANVSMYTRQDNGQVIVRMKGGPTKNQIETKPEFEKVRQNNSEWAGCTRMASNIRKSFEVMNRLEDYAVNGALNAVCKEIQKLDTGSQPGQRAIRLSEHKDLLPGFTFSRKQVLESVLRVPVETTLDRTTGKATLEIPMLNTDMYLYNFRSLPYYRFIASLSGVCDMLMDAAGDKYDSPYPGYCDKQNGVFESEWIAATSIQPALIINLSYPLTENPIPDEVTLLLCLGIEFGKVGKANQPTAVKYAGSGKIVRVE